MATDVSIQAVSPELGEQFVSVLASQDGGVAAAADAGASAAVSAIAEWKVGTLSKIARTSAPARANSPARENRLKVMVSLLSVFIEVRGYSKGGGVGFAGADPDRMIDTEDENLAVANLAGFRRGRNHLDDFVHLISRTGDFELDFRQEAHRVFGPAVDFSVTLLTPITLDLGDRQPLHPDLGKRVADLVELERLDDGHDDFHCFNLPILPSRVRRLGGLSLRWPRWNETPDAAWRCG